MVRHVFFLCLLAGITPFVAAQTKLTLIIKDTLPKEISYEKQVSDRQGAHTQILRIVTQLMNKGFLMASLDSVIYKNDTVYADVHIGPVFTWGNINYKYLPLPLMKQFGFDKSTKGTAALDVLKRSMTQTITYMENRGYPFAYFYWDSLVLRKDSIHGSVFFEKNIPITFDTLAIYGDPGVTKQFLYNYLGFKPGEPYNESLIGQINDKIMKLPFTSVVSRPQIFFVGRKAIVLLNLKKRRTDRLDGLIGFAPNTGLPGNTKLLVTGEFHLDFKNLKGTGKGIKADWQSFQARSQALNVALSLPYLLNQPIGADVSAGFLKYDTIFTETKFGLGIQYIFSGLDNFKVFYEQKNTNLQFADTNSIRITKTLGELTAMQTNRYGIALNMIGFDNRISPKKGYLADISISIFKREIQKDIRIENVKFYNAKESFYYTVYDSAKIKSYQIQIQYSLAKATLLAKRIVLFNELNGFHYVSPTVYFNELYRFGGNNTFKGFNEQSLFASSVSIFNLEVRYLLSELSFLKVFGNAAYYMDKSSRPGKINSDIPYGFGGGINLDTGGGIFNISVALGESKYNPIDFKNAKVHFGLINYF